MTLTEYEFIRIEKTGLSASGKTEMWAVISKRGGHFLGSLRWYARWRRYAFYPADNTVYSAGCLRDIGAFIDVMMKARKS